MTDACADHRCPWFARYAALERDHLAKWEQIDRLQRQVDALTAVIEVVTALHDTVDTSARGGRNE